MRRKKRNLLFLDIDGVLNSYTDVVERRKLLNQIEKSSDEELKKKLINKKNKLFPQCEINFQNKKEAIAHNHLK